VFLEFKAGKNKYGMMIPFGTKMDWKAVLAITADGITTNVTDEFLYFAGPFKNFYGLPVKPSHFNVEYTKIAFVWSEDDILEVHKDTIILQKFKERRDKLKTN